MSDWPVKPITEIVDFNPPRKIKKNSIAPFIDMASLPTGAREIVEVGEREFKGSGSKFQNGDTLFARITPCLENGKTAKVTKLNEGAVAHGSTEFIVMSAKDKQYDEDFVYCIARMQEFRNYAQSRMEGTSGRQRVPWQALATYVLPIPPKEIRKQIGDILSSIDDKIELNRQINQTLEQIAQAIFKSWFVDFEPVKAKIQAKQNAKNPERAAMCAISGKTEEELDQLSAEQLQQLTTTAALFPDELEESELGEIPKGWGVCSVDNVIKRLKPKKRYTKKQVHEYGSVPVFEQGASILLGYHNEEPGFDATPEKPLFIFGDHTCVCYLSCASFDISQNVIPLSGSKYPTIWVYYAVKDKQEFQEYRRHWSELIVKKIVKPHIGLCQVFSGFATKLYQKKEQSVEENNSLRHIRDTLLPKLLSGDLPVNQFEQ